MEFHSKDYGFFLVTVFSLFWLVAGRRRPRNAVLLLASWFFYASWKAPYLALILGSTLLDWWAGGVLARLPAEDPACRRTRRWVLLASLAGNLGALAVFKYYNFFRANFEDLFAGFGIHLPASELALPVGISFYTFQTLSYTIDIYRGELKPARNLREFALFVAFFPQLVAGPIVRAKDFLPQLERRPFLDVENLKRGLYRIAEGLGKKVLIADVLAVHLVDPVFAPGSQAGPLHSLLGVYGYAMQIYCDFAGYSDIAIGSALLFGFKIPENFKAPYLARSIQDFWRRWHISLSTWLRDYLYIPLGGNRRGPVRTYVNLMATMLLGGLWHGAAWRFVFWGGLHGAWLAVNRWWQRRGFGALPGPLGRVLATVLTFHLVCLAWVFFRASDLQSAFAVLGRIFGEGAALPSLPLSVWVALGLGYGTHLLPERIKAGAERLHGRMPAFVLGLFWSFYLGLLAYSMVEGVPFIYFQF